MCQYSVTSPQIDRLSKFQNKRTHACSFPVALEGSGKRNTQKFKASSIVVIQMRVSGLS